MSHRAAHRCRRALAAALTGGLLVTLTACGAAAKPKPEPQAAAPTTSATPSPTPAPLYWPLTGVQASALAARPALAVKIENSITARPQAGLDQADMVWEEVVEGGITRYMAVYQSTLPPKIGPVRSVRPMDPAIAAPMRGLLAFSGGQQTYISAAAHAGLQILSNDAGAHGFYRISSRPAPHNVYASPATLLGQADSAHRTAPTAPFQFATGSQRPTAVTTGKATTTLSLVLSALSHPHWTWSATHHAWVRSEFSTPAVDSSGRALTATNVVVLRVRVVDTSARDAAGNPVPKTELTGTGGALVASEGRTVDAVWTKGGDADPLALKGTDGAPVWLAPGNTWIELVPTGTGSVATG